MQTNSLDRNNKTFQPQLVWLTVPV